MTTVADIMTTNVVSIRSFATVAEAIKRMHQKNIQALIVQPTSPSDAYGIVTVSDVVKQVISPGLNSQSMQVHEIMTKPCIVINPHFKIEQAARLLTQSNLHSAPVVQTKLLGIVSVSDILAHSQTAKNPQERKLIDTIQKLTDIAQQIFEDSGPDSLAYADALAEINILKAKVNHHQAVSLAQKFSESFWNQVSDTFEDSDNGD